MNDAERISALEGLLVRIQKNAALPRPARAEAPEDAAPLTVQVKAHPFASAHPFARNSPSEPRVIAVVSPRAGATPKPPSVAAAPATPPRQVVAPATIAQQAPAMDLKPTPLPAAVSVFARESTKPPAASGVLPPGAGRYGVPEARSEVAAKLTLEMDDPLDFDEDEDEPTIMAMLPRLELAAKAAPSPPPTAKVAAEPIKAPPIIPEPSGSEPAILLLEDDADISFEDEVTHQSPGFAVAHAEAEAERRALEKSEAEGAAAAVKLTEAERRAEEWRLLEEEARHLEAEQIARAKAEALLAEAAENEEAARLAVGAAAKAEAERRAAEAEAAAKAEAEAARLAAEAATKAEAEAARLLAVAEAKRLAVEAAARAEADRLLAETAAKAEADRLAAKVEADRLAAKVEADRVAAKAEADRRAAEAAARAEADRRAAEAEQQAKLEAQRLAEEQAAAAAKASSIDEAPPASARLPRDSSRPVDEALVLDDDDDDAPPASGEVQSQRKPTIHDELTMPATAALSGWDDDETIDAPSALLAAQADEELRIAGKSPLTPQDEPTQRITIRKEPPPSRPLELRLAVEPPPAASLDVSPVVVDVAPQITSRPTSAADAASFLGSVRAEAPASFGALLDASLALGG